MATGQLNAENVAVGAKASAGTGVTDRVRHATGRGPASEDLAALVEATERAKEELARPDPNKFSFLGLLKGIGAGVGSVASLMTSVEAIEHLAVQLL